MDKEQFTRALVQAGAVVTRVESDGGIIALKPDNSELGLVVQFNDANQGRYKLDKIVNLETLQDAYKANGTTINQAYSDLTPAFRKRITNKLKMIHALSIPDPGVEECTMGI